MRLQSMNKQQLIAERKNWLSTLTDTSEAFRYFEALQEVRQAIAFVDSLDVPDDMPQHLQTIDELIRYYLIGTILEAMQEGANEISENRKTA